VVQALLAEICRDFVGAAAAKAWIPTNVSLKPTWVDESYNYDNHNDTHSHQKSSE
jgi:hypothetical protein